MNLNPSLGVFNEPESASFDKDMVELVLGAEISPYSLLLSCFVQCYYSYKIKYASCFQVQTGSNLIHNMMYQYCGIAC